MGDLNDGRTVISCVSISRDANIYSSTFLLSPSVNTVNSVLRLSCEGLSFLFLSPPNFPKFVYKKLFNSSW